tara:strand:- start:215 stop:757 length:543 start_codon:yes stop_codon:yes gene_type:complete
LKKLESNQLESQLDQYLRIRNSLNKSLLSENEIKTESEALINLKQKFRSETLDQNKIFEKKEALINNLSLIKESVECLSQNYPGAGLSKSQGYSNGGIELFKRLARETKHIICSKYNGGFGYSDLKITKKSDDIISYSSFIIFLNNEIRHLSDYDFEKNFQSFVSYYVDFENRIISDFNI